MTAVWFDASGIETTEDDIDAHTVKYSVKIPTALASASVETIMVVPVTTGAAVEIVYPEDAQLSSPPISGTFYASCYDTDGSKYDTYDMDIESVDAEKFQGVLERYCGFLKGKISVTKLTDTW